MRSQWFRWPFLRFTLNGSYRKWKYDCSSFGRRNAINLNAKNNTEIRTIMCVFTFVMVALVAANLLPRVTGCSNLFTNRLLCESQKFEMREPEVHTQKKLEWNANIFPELMVYRLAECVVKCVSLARMQWEKIEMSSFRVRWIYRHRPCNYKPFAIVQIPKFPA